MKNYSNRTAFGIATIIVVALAHTWLEASMARHMIIQLPSLFIAGWLLCGRKTPIKFLSKFDAHGLTSFVFAISVASYWMIPRALELATKMLPYEAAKFVTITLAGGLIASALKRANQIIQIFFIGNFCAMTAIFGLLYQDQLEQLCNSYTVDDQSFAGTGLVIIASTVPLLWCASQYRATADASPISR